MNATQEAELLRLASQDHGPVILGVVWFLCVFSAGFLVLRLYAKFSRRQGLWWDDYILILSWLLLLVTTGLTQAGRQLGLGKHVFTFKLENAFILARQTYIGASISCFAATFSKISFGVTLLRLTKGPLRAFVWLCIISLFIVMLPSAFLTWIQCKPTARLWNPFLEGTCWPATVSRDYGFFNAAFCAVIDFALALAPWKLLMGLQLKTKEKIGVGVAMSMGLLAGVCAIVKGVYLQEVTDYDFFYKGKDVIIWTSVETAAAIVGACIPVLRVFFKNTINSLHDRYHRTGDASNSDGVTTFGSSAVPMSNLNSQKSAARSSMNSVPGTGALGTVIANNEYRPGGIVQTNTITVEYSPYPYRGPRGRTPVRGR